MSRAEIAALLSPSHPLPRALPERRPEIHDLRKVDAFIDVDMGPMLAFERAAEALAIDAAHERTPRPRAVRHGRVHSRFFGHLLRVPRPEVIGSLRHAGFPGAALEMTAGDVL